MIGNDIVDLALAGTESNWLRPGYLDKIFSPSEQRLILNSNMKHKAVWDLWSRKEAAYKIYNRLSGQRAFIPLHFECQNALEGNRVVSKYGIYFTSTEITSEYVHTIAVADKADFDKILRIPREKVYSESGLPFYQNNPASVSHHGRFQAVIGFGTYKPSLDLSFRNNNATAYASSAEECRSPIGIL